MAIICIDYDDTLMDTKNVPSGKRLGPPMPGAVAAMKRLAVGGNILIIFTVRGGEERSRKAVADWLDYFGIPYSTITNIKTRADAYIDNHAIRFVTWPQTLSDLRKYQ